MTVIAFRVSRTQSLLAFGETAGKVLYGLNPLFYGLFDSGVIHRDVRQLMIAVIGLGFGTGINGILQWVGTSARLKQQVYVGFEFSRQIALMMSEIETLDHHEDPVLLDKLQSFRSWSGGVGGALNALLNMVNSVAWSATTLIVALSADWRLIILALLGIPRLLLVPVTQRWNKIAEETGSPFRRLADQLVDLTRDRDAGAESRVFALRTLLMQRISSSSRRAQRPDQDRNTKTAMLELGNGLFFFGGAAAIIGWMVHDAIGGTVAVSALTIAVTSMGSLQEISSGLVSTARWLGQESRSATRFVWLRDYAATIHARHTGHRRPPARLDNGIRLEHVSYRYNGADSDALCDVDLDLPAGTVVAVVGENGAGKSTLVKLLTGMYQPTGGRVLIDDVDLAEIDLDAWRARTSAAFQDHANLEFLAGEAIGLGDLDHIEDEPEINRALADGAASDVLTALPQRLQTQLGTTWPDGVNLSGGQWQRLAIARGMMRRQPLLLALDEPTSALDAATEHALFDRYATAARDAGRSGGVTVLVTHRFSTVAAADTVLVLAEGRIVEQGTHRQLMAAGGAYAELYEIQARGYR
ncbi:ABC transporter permease [Microlunatus endophyticus]|uniref:ABC transporter permease n=1 Tax=Microlunatus endophyticus TaxID=1716077 RepID=A0A917SA82_9ACTN|nr:ABC transporter permease [Microlunatus endophyticus]